MRCVATAAYPANKCRDKLARDGASAFWQRRLGRPSLRVEDLTQGTNNPVEIDVMHFLDSDHQALPSLRPLEQNMLRESYERAGSIARSMGVPRAANPYATSAEGSNRYAADKGRLRVLADHWWRGWDKAAPASGRAMTSKARDRDERS